MSNEKPSNIEEYKKWLNEHHKVKLEKEDETYYNSVANKILLDFKKSPFWLNLEEQRNQLNQQYYLKNSYYLFQQSSIPELCVKPYKSFIYKTFRLNILDNQTFPGPPINGWLLPDNWYENVKDIVRTFFVVKYLDGVNFLVEKIDTICKDSGLSCQIDFEAKEEGYYAAHVYIPFDCHVPQKDWDTKQLRMLIELQITTQLQEVIKSLLHKHYEQRRMQAKKNKIKWQWNYKSDEFATNYLGHILHYVEGMIMEIREKQERK